MEVRVRLYATLAQAVPEELIAGDAQRVRAGTPLEVELPEESTVSDLIARLELPAEKVRVVFVDGKVRGRDFRLSPGDEVGLFPAVGGG